MGVKVELDSALVDEKHVRTKKMKKERIEAICVRRRRGKSRECLLSFSFFCFISSHYSSIFQASAIQRKTFDSMRENECAVLSACHSDFSFLFNQRPQFISWFYFYQTFFRSDGLEHYK